MNTLRDTTNMELDGGMNSSPNSGSTGGGDENAPAVSSDKSKTPLKKEELEKIAKQLKKKLSKASITAKQQISPNASKVTKPPSANPSPLKSYSGKKMLDTPGKFDQFLSSSSPLYSPNNKSPTHMRSSAAASLLGSSPLAESPIKKQKHDSTSPLKNQSTMVLQPVSTPTKAKSSALKPSPPLSSQRGNGSSQHRRSRSGSQGEAKDATQTTPTLPKKQLAGGNPLLKTPTQPKNGSGNYNDEEGADLLMYLATSPSPAKSYFPGTPKLNGKSANGGTGNEGSANNGSTNNDNSRQQVGGPRGHSRNNSHSEHFGNTSAPASSVPFGAHKHTSSNSSANSFIAPPPPLTPKRHISSNISSKTPQNRLTPSMNLFNSMTNNASSNPGGLPSSGLALTPAGFNMNDYVNFFSPSPGGANLSRNLNNNFLKTPDFNNLLASANNHSSQNNATSKQAVDGKMINFDKVGLFKNSESKD